jgi:ketosteroid isomerase-like protein
MPTDHAEFLRRAIEPWSRFDEEAALAFLSEDIEFYALRSATEGTFHGQDGVRAFFADNRESFELFQPHYDDIRDLGDGRLLAIGSIRIRGRGSGVETDVASAVLVTIRDGRIAYFRDYGDRDAALEAAGLDPAG